ncbi:MAG TPA: metallophosphoesterase family protein [Chloroflexota bacterium]|nr:metallophosphoesterase family protein [Chloroflexota bacterium]
MTRWAFVADVHGNFRALARAEALAREGGVERFVALGDVLGRGQPAECVAWVRANAALAVVGNRDLDHLGLVSPADQAYLRSLPREATADDFLVTHGDAKLTPALASADERRGFRRAYAALLAADRRLWFFGHTHHARVWRKAASDAAPERLASARIQVEPADPAVRYLVNVGTTGRRLAGRGPASFTLYDSVAGWLVRVEL